MFLVCLDMQKSFYWDCNSEDNICLICLLLQEMIWVSELMARDWVLYLLSRRKPPFFLSCFLPLLGETFYCFSHPMQNDEGIVVFYQWRETEHCIRKTSVRLFLGTACRMLKYHMEASYFKSVTTWKFLIQFSGKTSKTDEAKTNWGFWLCG